MNALSATTDDRTEATRLGCSHIFINGAIAPLAWRNGVDGAGERRLRAVMIIAR